MVLHTDQKHPHVHLVVKAEHEFEPGRRLHIDKAMLRRWREQFAACLREQGIAAKQTREAVVAGWRTTAEALRAQGDEQLAREVEAFIAAMPTVRTEKEQIAAGLLAEVTAQRQKDQGGDTPPIAPGREG